jgi:hypothetical protein
VISLDLGTFGAIMKFALELENSVNKFYDETSKQAKDPAFVGLLENMVTRGKKRLKTLERVRRENVTEMILEPIEGLDSDSFVIDTTLSKDADDATIKTLAVSIETTLQNFYESAAIKIDFLPEAAYAFELLAEKNEETIRRF